MATGGLEDMDIFHNQLEMCSTCKSQSQNKASYTFCVDCDDYFCSNCVETHKHHLCEDHTDLKEAEVDSGKIDGLPIEYAKCHDKNYLNSFKRRHTFPLEQRDLFTNHLLFNHDKQKFTKTMSKRNSKSDHDFMNRTNIGKGSSLQDRNKVAGEPAVDLEEESSKESESEKFVHLKNKPSPNSFIFDDNCTEQTNQGCAPSDIVSRFDGEKHTFMSERDHTDMVTKNYLNFYGGHWFHDKRKTSLCVKVKSDANVCNIISSCFMEDGTLILADNNNYKLKRLDGNTYQVIDYCDISKDPRQLCYINESQVAVTLGSEKAVRFISLENEMKTAKQFKTKFDCYGIACADNYLYISSMKSIYIYTLSGQEIQQISKGRYRMSNFSDISSISVSKDASRIYIADYFGGFIVLSYARHVIKKFVDKQLQEANCCYITDAGSVLVSGEESNNVLLFTRNGRLLGEVVKADNEKDPVQSVCCNQQMSKVCVARLYENNVEMYTFNE